MGKRFRSGRLRDKQAGIVLCLHAGVKAKCHVREGGESRKRGKKLPTCGLRAVSLLIIIISWSYNGCLIGSDSFVLSRGSDKRVPRVSVL